MTINIVISLRLKPDNTPLFKKKTKTISLKKVALKKINYLDVPNEVQLKYNCLVSNGNKNGLE